MENKVSDNVIEKNYRECLKFNEINESNVYNFDLATGTDVALEQLLAAKGKFWEVVAAESKKNNLVR